MLLIVPNEFNYWIVFGFTLRARITNCDDLIDAWIHGLVGKKCNHCLDSIPHYSKKNVDCVSHLNHNGGVSWHICEYISHQSQKSVVDFIYIFCLLVSVCVCWRLHTAHSVCVCVFCHVFGAHNAIPIRNSWASWEWVLPAVCLIYTLRWCTHIDRRCWHMAVCGYFVPSLGQWLLLLQNTLKIFNDHVRWFEWQI